MKTLEKDKPSRIKPENRPPIFTKDRDRLIASAERRERASLTSLGILQVVLGVIAVVLPFVAVLYFGILLGALTFLSGVVQLVAAGRNRSLSKALIGAVPLAAGIVILANRQLSFAVLVTVFVLYLLLTGAFRLLLSLRNRTVAQRNLAFFGGIYGLALGILMLAGWPGNTAIVLGLFVGTNILFGGILILLFAGENELIV